MTTYRTQKHMACLAIAAVLFAATGCGGSNSSTARRQADTTTRKPIDTASTVKIVSGAAGDTSFLDFAMISDAGYVIAGTIDTTWCKSKPGKVLEYGANVYAVTTEVIPDSLPASYRALIHRRIRVFDASGENGIAEITGFKILAEFIPHFGQVQRWHGSFDESPAMKDDQVAMDILRSAPCVLVADYEFTDKKTTPGNDLFVVAENRTRPRVYGHLPTGPIEKTVMASVTRVDTYRNIQREYEQIRSARNAWTTDTVEGTSDTSYFYFRNSAGVGFAAVSLRAGNECGGDFFAELYTLWQLGGTAPKLLYADKTNATILAAIDIDNDDFPELLIQTGSDYYLYKFSDGVWEKIYSYGILYQDCPC